MFIVPWSAVCHILFCQRYLESVFSYRYLFFVLFITMCFLSNLFISAQTAENEAEMSSMRELMHWGRYNMVIISEDIFKFIIWLYAIYHSFISILLKLIPKSTMSQY